MSYLYADIAVVLLGLVLLYAEHRWDKRKDTPMTAEIVRRLTLDPTTVQVLEIGVDNDHLIHVAAYDLEDSCPLPRRRVAQLLRDLADNLDAEAAKLDALEPKL